MPEMMESRIVRLLTKAKIPPPSLRAVFWVMVHPVMVGLLGSQKIPPPEQPALFLVIVPSELIGSPRLTQ